MKTQITQQILFLKKNHQRKNAISVNSIKKWVVKLELPLPAIE